MRYGLLVICLAWLASCKPKEALNENVSDLFSVGIPTGYLKNKEINEASGIVRSVGNPGKLWVHNDSGDKPRIFLIDSTGQNLATVYIKGASHRDWEDIAIGPGPEDQKSYLYIADIGDNDAINDTKKIYRLIEPTSPAPYDTVTTGVDSIEFVMEDGARDTEAIMLDPATKDLYVFSKREQQIKVYVLKYPQQTTGIDTAKIVLQLPHRQVVAADISHSGNEILMKTYDSIFYWQKKNGESIEELLKSEPVQLPYQPEPQGEAISFSLDSEGYYTVSEIARGEKATLYFYKRK